MSVKSNDENCAEEVHQTTGSPPLKSWLGGIGIVSYAKLSNRTPGAVLSTAPIVAWLN
ncbi:MAG: hypothetical protein MZV49_08905 [Rhodopseudomonas palustris]|nr:hypothetical protein [Rhodopseudomonas palustris]